MFAPLKTLAVVALAILLPASLAFASPPTDSPSVQAAAPAEPLAAGDLAVLREHVNQTVDVRGTPTSVGHNKAGTVAYLDFGPAHQALTAVAFLGTGPGETTGKKLSEDDLRSFVGKVVVVHGKLAEFHGDLQIVLNSADQIQAAP